jgi:hypothetical protein
MSDPAADPPAQPRRGDPGARPARPGAGDDPVRQRRARLGRLAALGQRVGYGLFAVAVVAFFVGLAEGFPTDIIDLIIGCMALGSVLLAPSIVLAYAVKAAERDDEEHGR